MILDQLEPPKITLLPWFYAIELDRDGGRSQRPINQIKNPHCRSLLIFVAIAEGKPANYHLFLSLLHDFNFRLS